jgi:hypothetical protein
MYAAGPAADPTRTHTRSNPMPTSSRLDCTRPDLPPRRARGLGPLVVLTCGLSLLAGGSLHADSHLTASTPGATLYIISPADGETLTSPVTVRFGLRGMGVAPAGVEKPGTGHHHLVIDADAPSLVVPLPADAHNRHFGGGQTEVDLELEPGRHTLQLILGDFRHIPHQPPLQSERIEITVR